MGTTTPPPPAACYHHKALVERVERLKGDLMIEKTERKEDHNTIVTKIDKLNESVVENKMSLTKIMTIGAIGFTIINIAMRFLP